jgi:hypothetical protein
MFSPFCQAIHASLLSYSVHKANKIVYIVYKRVNGVRQILSLSLQLDKNKLEHFALNFSGHSNVNQ